jgi:uncharacterized NAD(P)/FAD-binding protein YdhS
MKHIAIIGGGFCGVMTAVNLIKDAKYPLKITLIHSGTLFIRGVAYSSYSNTHLLNVASGNMSAFANDAKHFTNWLHTKKEYSNYEKDLLEKTYIPRNLYGEYLSHIWETTLTSKSSTVELSVIDDYVNDIELQQGTTAKIILNKGLAFIADYVVLATGNSLPRNLPIANKAYYSSPTYFQNPWSIDSVSNLNPKGDVLIIGNGLTMTDTVIGLIEHGFKNKIYSVSTNGFSILPHRHFGINYNELVEELPANFELIKLVRLVNKHIKKVRKLGISAAPVIDSLRPYSQKIWQAFTLQEKKQFISRYRHMWGVARHRLPVFIYDIIEKLRIKGQLVVYRGKVIDITEKEKEVSVTFYNTKKRYNETLVVQRVINCTGPETSIYKTLNPLLHKLAEKGIITSDPLELGISADISTYNVLTAGGEKRPSIFTLGTNLKGVLWETIAVPELRIQCQQLSNVLLKACEQSKK